MDPSPPQPHRPLCFVLMPFGTKPDGQGGTVNFDEVYQQLIKPAIEAAGLESLRADAESAGGFIHKPMFERLLLCDYAVADLTAANANVFYELGVRHAMRPGSTIMLFAAGGRLPFDVAALRTLPYQLGPGGVPSAAAADASNLTKLLNVAQQEEQHHEKGCIDSPLFQIVDNYPAVDKARTEVFRDEVAYSAGLKQQLARARTQSLAAVQAVAATLDLATLDAGVLIDLLLSYRDKKGWPDMLALVGQLRPELASAALVQEQYGLALNRNGQNQEAEQVLKALVQRRGPSSETLGILGRVYKDQWDAAVKNNDKWAAKALLQQTIDTYLKGFETDWRDAYPGVNAVTMMALADPVDPRQQQVLPVVRYAVERKITAGNADYWDYATLLTLGVLAGDQAEAERRFGQFISPTSGANEFAFDTTANTLRQIREARERRGEAAAWIAELEQELLRRAAQK